MIIRLSLLLFLDATRIFSGHRCINTNEVNADRFFSVKALQKKFDSVVILKGAGSLIASASDIFMW
jgi:NAD(P)H-hydrate repair Nnr-like enzyme with NAD(P)H-hydrate dehydratase domain